MHGLRNLRLLEAKERVLRVAHFRDPQRKSFDRVTEILERLPDDLPFVSQSELVDVLAGLGLSAGTNYPDFQFELATGVGKRRLMGSIAAYLVAAGQTRNIVILAPREYILDKLEDEVDPASPHYLFLDQLLVPDPHVCFRSNTHVYQPSDDRVNVFILSPQTITGANRRFARKSEFADASLLDYLQGLDDLIVLTDEAHHIGDVDTAWGKAVETLQPRMHFGFTATARPGASVLHNYGLAECLRDGRYTKALQIYAKRRDEDIKDDDWDHLTIDYALARLRTKEAAVLAEREINPEFPQVRPVLLLSARDTKHSEAIGKWLVEHRQLPENAVHVTHSQKRETETEIRNLLELDRLDNPIRVVVQVDRLSEGWDVTNVYVVAPLRPMGTYRLAMQSVGRGLRLPLGARTGIEEIDTLDVICFGRESTQEILEEAKRDFRDPELDTPLIKVSDSDDAQNEELEERKPYLIKAKQEVEFTVPTVERIPAPVHLGFAVDVPNRIANDLVSKITVGAEVTATGDESEGISHPLGALVRQVRLRVCQDLEYLDQISHGAAVEALVKATLAQMGVEDSAPDDTPIYIDPYRLSAFLAGEIHRRHRRQDPVFKVHAGAKPVRLADVTVQVPASFKKPSKASAVQA